MALDALADGGHTVEVDRDWPEQEFRSIFREHYPRVLATLLRIVRSRAEAEELASEVFLKLFRQVRPAENFSNLGGWLYRTATRTGLDALRSRRRRERYEGQAAEPEETIEANPAALALRNEQQRRVRAALGRMKPLHAQLLLLRHAGLSYAELAEALKVKASSIGTLLVRAEAQFARFYGREDLS
jgi:RNA polymerase sigma-70 factor (ECF subfamily)